MSIHGADSLVNEAAKRAAAPAGPTPAEAAIDLLAATGKFDSKRTIYRRIEQYRKSIDGPSPRPYRPPRRKRARRVPTR